MCEWEAANCPDIKNHKNCVSSLRVTRRGHNGDVAMANSFVTNGTNIIFYRIPLFLGLQFTISSQIVTYCNALFKYWALQLSDPQLVLITHSTTYLYLFNLQALRLEWFRADHCDLSCAFIRWRETKKAKLDVITVTLFCCHWIQLTPWQVTHTYLDSFSWHYKQFLT